MKILIASLLLFASSAFAAPVGVVYDFKVTRVIDGDTVEFQAPFLVPPLKPVLSIRVLGIDTPEKFPRAKCALESRRGADATAFTKDVVKSAKRIQVEIVQWDKYGGRVLGDIILDGQRLSEMLITNKLARPYHGEAKQSWCQ